MHKVVKDALAKGKVLQAALDAKKAREAKEAEDTKKAKEAEEKAKLDAEVERYLSYIPDCIANAVAERKPSFSLVTYESDKSGRFALVCALLEPKLKKLGLQFKHTSSTSWVQLTYDPDTGYDATYYHLEVMVPTEDA